MTTDRSPFALSPRLPRARRGVVGFIALALGGCATVAPSPALKTEVTVPGAWQQAQTAATRDDAALATWWRCFDDPTLESLITLGLAGSPDVRTAWSRIAEYRARRGLERAALFPSLSANASGGASRTHVRATDTTSNAEAYGASLDASWQVDLFGQQTRLRDAASADLAQTEALWQGTRVSLAATVATAYVSLRSAQAQVAVVEHSLGTRTDTAQLTQWREQSGLGTSLETQQALGDLEQARASLPTLQLTATQATNALTQLIGRAPGGLDAELTSPAPAAVPVATTVLAAGLPAETLRQRPDVRAAEHAITAAHLRTSAARRSRLPSFSLSGSLGIAADHPSQLFSPQSTVASLLGDLSAPLFDAGRIRRNITIQSEAEQQALLAYESVVLNALTEVENALAAVRRHQERGTVLARATAATQNATTLAALEFKSGQVDLFVSLDAQRNLLALQQQQVVTAADQAAALIQLYTALGGGWAPLP